MTETLSPERQKYLEEGEKISKEMEDLLGKKLNLRKLHMLLASGTGKQITDELAELRAFKDEKIKQWWDNDSSFRLSDIFRFIAYWARHF
jgi:hypothetical protein